MCHWTQSQVPLRLCFSCQTEEKGQVIGSDTSTATGNAAFVFLVFSVSLTVLSQVLETLANLGHGINIQQQTNNNGGRSTKQDQHWICCVYHFLLVSTVSLEHSSAAVPQCSCYSFYSHASSVSFWHDCIHFWPSHLRPSGLKRCKSNLSSMHILCCIWGW